MSSIKLRNCLINLCQGLGGSVGSVCILAFILVGCSGNPAKKVEKKPKAAAEAPAAESSGEVVAPIERIPNPYLTQKVKVPDAASDQFKTATVLMQGEHWDQAEKTLRAMTTAFPTLAGPYANLGVALAHQDKWDEAKVAFEKALQVNPLNDVAYVQYGFYLREHGEFALAEKVYLKALEVWPHNLPAVRNLGILYDLYMGKFDQALVQYELALRLSPEPRTEIEGWIADLKRRIATQ